MFPLLETVRFDNGRFSNIDYHIKRMKYSAKECLNDRLNFNTEEIFKLAEKENANKKGLFKFRLLYNAENYKTEFVKYSLPEIKTLKPVECNNIEYHCKFTDRKILNDLKSKKGGADDILIIKNGFVTDTSFSNIIFFDGKNWVTPDTPLLAGTQRAYLLEKRLIKTKEVKITDIQKYKKARIINAMIRFEDEVDVEIIFY